MPIDPAYRTVSREEFPAMLEVGRYAQRSPHFEEIIARTEEHFWNPEDPDYVDLATPPPAGEPLLPFNFIVEAHTAMWVDMDELAAEGDRMVGDDVAEEGIESLTAINATKRKIVRRISA